jgi:hypothetical protein
MIAGCLSFSFHNRLYLLNHIFGFLLVGYGILSTRAGVGTRQGNTVGAGAYSGMHAQGAGVGSVAWSIVEVPLEGTTVLHFLIQFLATIILCPS